MACNVDDEHRRKKLDTRQLDYTVDDIRQEETALEFGGNRNPRVRML